MNINSWFARGMVCMAAISFALGASACSAKEPSNTSAIPNTIAQSGVWKKLASNTPADMHEVQGNTFGVDGWMQATKAGQGQGFFGVAPLGQKCVVIVSPGTLAQPDRFSVEIETVDYQLVTADTNQSVDGIQQLINDSRASCG